MPRYIVTTSAGPYVAGVRNPGAGKSVRLSARQAAHELRLGSLKPASAKDEEPKEKRKERSTLL